MLIYSRTFLIIIMKELFEKLLERLINANKVVFMGIGEEKLTDDAVGVYIVTELLDYSNERFLFINAGIDPMSRIDDVVSYNPSHLVIIDTCSMNSEPGTVAIIERENIFEYIPISTHTIPIHIVIDLLIEKLPKLQSFMIGIVPESLEGFTKLKLYKENEFTLEERSKNIDLPFFELNLTPTIKNVADQLVRILIKLIEKL
ncbi:MAG: hydrogenase maturation protease [Promethearchaeota archaeon]